ncbi:LysR family transcriptional regulator [Nocardiopsis sp. HNM0947]|uniref:LysR family transcriptional regulator n=1 Tax=Nocardiopsis coralli TaxID=2772213 RepID=A0ABR9P372_9ACTN|nr:LysR substrate-binding domain-containing protein [Nocardiopsis coralli]MBE2998276.1 LysR family transcriptional regulator [Nocardiopsis coralli]
MDLRLLEYFVAVTDHGGVTRAAHALYIAQPSLSQAIRGLERETGATLFDRGGRHMVLTPAGRAFDRAARQTLRDVERARSRVESVRTLRSGRLQVAALGTLAMDPLPSLVGQLNARHPGVQVWVSDPGGPDDIEGAIRRGEVELGLSEHPPRSDTLRSQRIGSRPIALVMPRPAAEALPDPVPLDRVADLPLVLTSSEQAGRSHLDEAVERVAGNVVVRSAHRQVVWDLVEAGVGSTFLPFRLAEEQMSGVAIRRTEPALEQQIGLVHRPGPLSPAARALVRLAVGEESGG